MPRCFCSQTRLPFLLLYVASTLTFFAACDKKAEPPASQSTTAKTAVKTSTSKSATSVTPENAAKDYRTPEQIKQESRQYGHVPIVGPTTPEAVTSKFKNWKTKADEAKADASVSTALAKVDPGATVTVIFGTWCKDCYRELPQLWKAIEVAGGESKLPFKIKYIGLDETFGAPGVDLSPYNVTAIPTMIVSRDGKEVGRMVESSLLPVETTLLALLNGDKQGLMPQAPATP